MEIEGIPSEWKQQQTGIRQGCPLSPYLFIVYMTVMFSDVKRELGGSIAQHRVTGATFDEVLFADDTICITRDTRTMNKMLKAIEEVGLRSGMKLNKAKCEVMQFGGRATIRFKNKEPVKAVQVAKYLGCMLNKENNPTIEVRGRIRVASGILKRCMPFGDTATAQYASTYRYWKQSYSPRYCSA